MKTLVAFATKGGTTEDYAKEIAKVLDERGMNTEIVNLRKISQPISDYDNIVVGTGIRAGRPYNEAVNFLKKDFTGKKLAVFFSTMETPRDAMNKYAIIAKNPVSVGILGGKFKMLWKNMNKVDMEAAKKWAADLAGTFRD